MSYENAIKWFYIQETKGFRFPDDAMLDVCVFAYYGIPKSDSKKTKELKLSGEIRPTKRPDWDNVGKCVCDSLNKIAYHDDSNVVDGRVRKFYSDKPRLEVIIRQV